MFRPGAKLAEFVLMVRNKPGIASRVLNVFQSRGVNLMAVHFGLPWRDALRGTGFIIGDFAATESGPAALADALKQLEGVESVSFAEADPPDWLVEDAAFPLTTQDAPLMVLNVKTFAQALAALTEKLGTGADAVLYWLGEELGRAHHERVRERFGAYYDPRDLLEKGLKMMQASGWAQIVDAHVEADGTGFVRLRHLFTGGAAGFQAPAAACHLIRGYCTAMRKAIFKAELESAETVCVLRGGELHEFVFRHRIGTY